MLTNHCILEIKDLEIAIHDKIILQNLNLSVSAGEVHAIMGPNGGGKSTLANFLARKQNYELKKGHIHFLGSNLLSLSPEECAWKGLFLGFQYPVAIPGISNIQFLKTIFNTMRKAQGKEILDAIDFSNFVKEKMAILDIPETFLHRSVNEGFSGGEKKRNEILQMSLLEPKLAILDEIDSGLDIDALKSVSNSINRLRSPDRAILLITHYQRLLDYIEPDYIHVLSQGKMIHSGDKTLAQKLESKGYSWLTEEIIA